MLARHLRERRLHVRIAYPDLRQNLIASIVTGLPHQAQLNARCAQTKNIFVRLSARVHEMRLSR